MPWYYYGSDAGWLMPLTMVIGMALFWGGMLFMVVLVLRHYGSAAQRHRNAEQVLAERLARGEIDENEYTRLRDVLRAH
ncbi:SHOCT domain-containing protein [Kutzneria kofuensis]|uniref:Putative membrane protein n=1 Tax=Kutzneria kofuensis TaxID=103725 RepID=A0A7W9NMP4_9PSEU|nr:SHOCT domain-containing protein [Kutzneria kofuensis]MBB5898059.1 putative membrane protein [Kutzneria kofuensis]